MKCVRVCRPYGTRSLWLLAPGTHVPGWHISPLRGYRFSTLRGERWNWRSFELYCGASLRRKAEGGYPHMGIGAAETWEASLEE